MLDLTGRTIGAYQIVEQVGKGGMANIYRAYQPSLDRDVAIKVLPPYYAEQDSSFLTRFKREAQAIAKLRHPNILMVLDFGEEDDIAYIVMEYVKAGTLKEHLEKPITLSEIYTIIGQIAAALDYAHSEGIVHRDIKPSNILMPKPDWALLTDFGLAKMVGGTYLTQSGLTVGTPIYMSPEQGSGRTVDKRSDIYSLGVMLYEMVVGEVPYTAETPMAVVVKHIVEPLPVISSKHPDVPEMIQRTILKAMAKEPDDRFQNASEIVTALTQIAGEQPEWQVQEKIRPQDPKVTKIIDRKDSIVEDQANTLKLWPFLAGAAGIVAIFLAALAVGSFGLFSWLKSDLAPSPIVENTALPAATKLPPPTIAPLPPLGQPPPPTQRPEPRQPGDILFEDDFSDPNSGWDRDGDKEGFTNYRDGTYNIKILPEDLSWFSNPYQRFGDVRVEVDTRLVEGTENNGFGIICAYRDFDNFFVTTISSDGYYGFQKNEGGRPDWIGNIGMQPTDAINLGGALNRIRVDCLGDTIRLFVNGEFVDEVSGLNLGQGDVGLWAETFGDPHIEIEFDNFVVSAP